TWPPSWGHPGCSSSASAWLGPSASPDRSEQRLDHGIVTDHGPRADPPASEGGGHRAAALAVLVAAVGLALFGLGLTVIARPAWDVGQWFYAVDTVDAVVYGLVAWLLLDRLRHAVAWIIA